MYTKVKGDSKEGLSIKVEVSSPNAMTHKAFHNAFAAAEYLMKHCTPDERLALLYPYCKGCGTDVLPCHCQNDE